MVHAFIFTAPFGFLVTLMFSDPIRLRFLLVIIGRARRAGRARRIGGAIRARRIGRKGRT
jgi:hypothetical protein